MSNKAVESKYSMWLPEEDRWETLEEVNQRVGLSFRDFFKSRGADLSVANLGAADFSILGRHTNE